MAEQGIEDGWARLEEALVLALSVRGTTLPNPAVGAVVWDAAGRIVGRGATSPPGGRHAEAEALAQAGEEARGGGAAVTLEPCVSFAGKRTPSCAEALAAAGVRRVYIGSFDPHPGVAGRGVELLRRAGIEVLLASEHSRGGRLELDDFYAGFGLHARLGRPRVSLKIALSTDGMAAAAPGVRTAITGGEARAFVHGLRARSDAVLVGQGTVLADAPRLTVRDAPGRSPTRLALWGSRPVPAWSPLYDATETPTVFLGLGPRPAALPRSVEWVDLAEVAGAGREGDARGGAAAKAAVPASSNTGGSRDPLLTALLAWCGSRGMHDLLVEPGPRLLATFLQTGAWDRLWVLRGPRALPGGLLGDPGGLLPADPPLEERRVGEDRLARWERASGG